MKILNLLLILLLLQSCNSGNGNYDDDYYDEEYGYEDGTYCADVHYYNPNTGTESDYILNVEVENNELVLIHWANGGWLDEDHFYAQELDENGWCSFTSDKGYEYEVYVTGPECSFTDERRAEYQVESDMESITCPNCGYDKEEYEDYCDNCTDVIQNTCSSCGNYSYGVYGGICEDCENDDW